MIGDNHITGTCAAVHLAQRALTRSRLLVAPMQGGLMFMLATQVAIFYMAVLKSTEAK